MSPKTVGARVGAAPPLHRHTPAGLGRGGLDPKRPGKAAGLSRPSRNAADAESAQRAALYYNDEHS